MYSRSWAHGGLIFTNLSPINLSNKLKPLTVSWDHVDDGHSSFSNQLLEAKFQRTNQSQQLTQCTKLDENTLCSPNGLKRNSELRMVRPAGQQGDRQMAKGSCLDDKGRKNKMQEKTRTLSSKNWGTPSVARHFPAGEGRSSRTRGQEEAFSPGHPACYQETCWGGCHWAGCWKQDVVPRPLPMPGSALKNWTSANRNPFTLQRAGFP